MSNINYLEQLKKRRKLIRTKMYLGYAVIFLWQITFFVIAIYLGMLWGCK